MTPDILVFGEALVDFVPTQRGRLRHVSGFELHSGGAPGNVAIGCARLGARSGLVSVVGDDEFGFFLRQAFEAEGVDASQLRHAEGERTGLCFITLDGEGERRFTHRGGAPETLLSVGDVDEARCRASKILQFSAGVLREAAGVAALHHAIDHAGGLVCTDPGTTPRHWVEPEVLEARLAGALARCDVVKCSADETLTLTGHTDPMEAAQALIAQGASLAVVTLGGDGALWVRAGDHGRLPSPAVEVVDTTGAGDAFMAALLVRLAADPEHPRAIPAERLSGHVAFACEIGAYAVRALGAVAGVPRLVDLEPGR